MASQTRLLAGPTGLEEQQNIDVVFAHTGHDSTTISVSEAHTAMEYYRFADSADAFSELSTGALSHLYFLRVQNKLVEYDGMDMNERMTWSLPRMRTIQKYGKRKLIKSLVEAVRALPFVCEPVN
jgi:hypothetical protein